MITQARIGPAPRSSPPTDPPGHLDPIQCPWSRAVENGAVRGYICVRDFDFWSPFLWVAFRRWTDMERYPRPAQLMVFGVAPPPS